MRIDKHLYQEIISLLQRLDAHSEPWQMGYYTIPGELIIELKQLLFQIDNKGKNQ